MVCPFHGEGRWRGRSVVCPFHGEGRWRRWRGGLVVCPSYIGCIECGYELYLLYCIHQTTRWFSIPIAKKVSKQDNVVKKYIS